MLYIYIYIFITCGSESPSITNVDFTEKFKAKLREIKFICRIAIQTLNRDEVVNFVPL